jgi:hypothetical protein
MIFHIGIGEAMTMGKPLKTPPEGDGKLDNGGDLCYPYLGFQLIAIVQAEALEFLFYYKDSEYDHRRQFWPIRPAVQLLDAVSGEPILSGRWQYSQTHCFEEKTILFTQF